MGAHPNPFADSFSIRAENKTEKHFSLMVYDLAGRLVKTEQLI
jgi:hypothetical protein